MNNRYFICKTHKKYTDAGYRWAYWQLENKGVITLGAEVDVNAVLSEYAYWNPDEADKSEWLCAEILPTARQFLETHRTEGIEYVDEDFLYAQGDIGYEWREVVSTNKGEQVGGGNAHELPSYPSTASPKARATP